MVMVVQSDTSSFSGNGTGASVCVIAERDGGKLIPEGIKAYSLTEIVITLRAVIVAAAVGACVPVHEAVALSLAREAS